jgi:hypothetical protein
LRIAAGTGGNPQLALAVTNYFSFVAASLTMLKS